MMARHRRNRRIAGALAVAVGMAAFACAGDGADDDPLERIERGRRAVADRMEGATVLVVVLDRDGDPAGFGTGYIVGDGLAVTNGHVVGLEGRTAVLLANPLLGTVRARVLAEIDDDRGRDFALLRFRPPAGVRPPRLAFNLRVNRMDRISVWGFPGAVAGLDVGMERLLAGRLDELPPLVYSEGAVRALVRQPAEVIVHTAHTSGGNSGSPLVNRRGEVVGMHTWSRFDENAPITHMAVKAADIVEFLRGVDGFDLTRLDIRAADPYARAPLAARPAPAASDEAEDDEDGEEEEGEDDDDDDEEPVDGADVLRRARAGEADAMLAVAHLYSDGEGGLDLDPKEAVRWARLAARTERKAEADALLGYLLLFEEDVRDTARGLAHWRAAAEANAALDEPDFDLSALLAHLLYFGEPHGIPRDIDGAARWARHAADAGHPDAKALLGFLYLYGEGVDFDEEKALALAREAERDDSDLGRTLMAWILHRGAVTPRDADRALALATAAAEADDAMAQGLLALMHAEDANFGLAEGWARRAAEQANEFGQFVMGRLYLDGFAVDPDPALAWAHLDCARRKNVTGADALLERAAALLDADGLARAKAIQAEWRAGWGLDKSENG